MSSRLILLAVVIALTQSGCVYLFIPPGHCLTGDPVVGRSARAIDPPLASARRLAAETDAPGAETHAARDDAKHEARRATF